MAEQVYYSINPYGTGDLKVACNISISGGVATFSVAQTGNIGVGCHVISANIDGFISVMTSSTTATIVTALGVAHGNVSSEALTSVSHEYASLSAALAGFTDSDHINSTDLTTADVIVKFPCYYDQDDDTTDADTGTLNAKTDSTRYIKVYAPQGDTESINNQRFIDGKWTTNRYRVVTDSALITIGGGDTYDLRVEGIQCHCTNTASGERNMVQCGAGSGQVADYRVQKCIFRFNDSSTNIRSAVRISSSGNSGSALLFENNIVYGGVGANTTSVLHINDSDFTVTFNNNTVYNMGYGVNATYTCNVKNSLLFNNTDDFNGAGISATYCASDDSETGTGNFQITQTASDYAALVTDAPNGDFSVKDASSELYNAGTNTGAPSDDIIGTSRPQATTVDIGAFEFEVSAGTFQPAWAANSNIIIQHGVS